MVDDVASFVEVDGWEAIGEELLVVVFFAGKVGVNRQVVASFKDCWLAVLGEEDGEGSLEIYLERFHSDLGRSSPRSEVVAMKGRNSRGRISPAQVDGGTRGSVDLSAEHTVQGVVGKLSAAEGRCHRWSLETEAWP